MSLFSLICLQGSCIEKLNIFLLYKNKSILIKTLEYNCVHQLSHVPLESRLFNTGRNIHRLLPCKFGWKGKTTAFPLNPGRLKVETKPGLCDNWAKHHPVFLSNTGCRRLLQVDLCAGCGLPSPMFSSVADAPALDLWIASRCSEWSGSAQFSNMAKQHPEGSLAWAGSIQYCRTLIKRKQVTIESFGVNRQFLSALLVKDLLLLDIKLFKNYFRRTFFDK